MNVMIGVREPSVHIGSQYIHIHGIWQVWISFTFERTYPQKHHLMLLVNAFNVLHKT
jgi:hypothetical protein